MSIINEKPIIPENILSRMIEYSDMPVGMQNGTKRAVDSRRLARRLRVAEAFTKAGAGLHGQDTWNNISEFMAAAISQGDFKTMDHFCEAWLKLKDSMKPAQAANRCISGAIIHLQRTLKRAPTNREIVERCATHTANNPKKLKISKSSVSSFVESLEMGDCLSSEKRGRKN